MLIQQISPTKTINEASHPLKLDLEQLYTDYDPTYKALWCTFKSKPIPAFTPTLLQNIRRLQDTIAQYCSEMPKHKPHYLIWMSDNPNVFSLGLDLKHIHDLIIHRDEENLDQYLQTCIDVLYINLMKLDISPLITITLLRGKAYGGGFEAALSSDIVVAEKNALCSFPEIRYNLLPSLGTLNMLLRRYSPSIIDPLIFEGKHINTDQLARMGLAHEVVMEGSGKEFILKKLQQIHSRHSLYASIYKTKNTITNVTFNELEEFRKEWIKTALRLKPEHLQRICRFANAQKKMLGMRK